MTEPDLRAQLSALGARLENIESALKTEHSSGLERGRDQGGIRERVAILETDQKHLLTMATTLAARIEQIGGKIENLPVQMRHATWTSAGGAGALISGVVWWLTQSGLVGGPMP